VQLQFLRIVTRAGFKAGVRKANWRFAANDKKAPAALQSRMNPKAVRKRYYYIV